MTLRFMTAGESHGPRLTAIVDGMPAEVPVTEDDIERDLARRQQGYGRGGRMRIEQDRATITGGVEHGLTTGGPVSLQIENLDWPNWKDRTLPTLTAPRPGHADWAGAIKYGHEDFRTVLERSSARETAARVAAGAVARRFLAEIGVMVHGHVTAIGQAAFAGAISYDQNTLEVIEQSPVRCPDPVAAQAMMAAIDAAKAQDDTLGGTFEVVALGMPAGLGTFVQWDRRLDGLLAQAVMSIQAIKGVEIGDGFLEARRTGTQAHDHFDVVDGRLTRVSNRAGGIEGGVSNGQPIVVRAAMKPISTTLAPQRSVDMVTGEESLARYQRSDTCAVPAAEVIAEAMVALVLAGVALDKFGSDNLSDIRAAIEQFRARSDYWLRPGARNRPE